MSEIPKFGSKGQGRMTGRSCLFFHFCSILVLASGLGVVCGVRALVDCSGLGLWVVKEGQDVT